MPGCDGDNDGRTRGDCNRDGCGVLPGRFVADMWYPDRPDGAYGTAVGHNDEIGVAGQIGDEFLVASGR